MSTQKKPNSRLAALAGVASAADDLPDGEAVDVVMRLLLGEGAGHGGTPPDPSLCSTTVEAGVGIVPITGRCCASRAVVGRPTPLIEDGRGQHGTVVVADPAPERQAAARADDGALPVVVVAVRASLLHLAAGADGRAEVVARRRVDAVAAAAGLVGAPSPGGHGRGGAVVRRNPASTGVHGGDAIDEGAAEGRPLLPARGGGPSAPAAFRRHGGRGDAGRAAHVGVGGVGLLVRRRVVGRRRRRGCGRHPPTSTEGGRGRPSPPVHQRLDRLPPLLRRQARILHDGLDRRPPLLLLVLGHGGPAHLGLALLLLGSRLRRLCGPVSGIDRHGIRHASLSKLVMLCYRRRRGQVRRPTERAWDMTSQILDFA